MNKSSQRKNIFTEHPNSVGESYFKHFGKSFNFCVLLLSLSFKAIVHAIFPFCYTTSVSDKVIAISEQMRSRRIKAIKEN